MIKKIEKVTIFLDSNTSVEAKVLKEIPEYKRLRVEYIEETLDGMTVKRIAEVKHSNSHPKGYHLMCIIKK